MSEVVSSALYARLLAALPPRRDGRGRMGVVSGEVVSDFGLCDGHGLRIARNLAHMYANPIYLVAADGELLVFDRDQGAFVAVTLEEVPLARTPRRRWSALSDRPSAAPPAIHSLE